MKLRTLSMRKFAATAALLATASIMQRKAHAAYGAAG